jgi:hypothetical protein
MINSILKAIKERIKKYKVEYILFIIIGILSHSFLKYFFFDYNASNDKNYSNMKKNVNKLCNDCFFNTKNYLLQKISFFTKGEKYIVQKSDLENVKYRKECIITNWNMIHFASHLCITFLFPYFYREIFACSFLYEIYEYIFFKCHDIADIFYNVIGIFTGYQLRQIYDKY